MRNVAHSSSVATVLLVILALTVVFFTVAAVSPRPQNHEGENPLIAKGDMPILVAHRGGDGEFPGNTLEAFYNAYSVDERVIMETDVNLTADGVLILCHETYLDKRTNASGDIIDWKYTDLIEQRVDFGYKNDTDKGERKHFTDENGQEIHPSDLAEYPEGLDGRDSEIFLATTLEELLVSFPDTIVSVEIKQGGDTGFAALSAALELVERLDAFDRVIFASFHDEIYNEYKRLAASDEVPDSFMFSPSMGGVIKYYALYILGLDAFFDDEISILQIPKDQYGIDLSSKRLIEYAHKHNIAVHYWTINDEAEMLELIESGADAIMTDYPHKLAAVYASLGK